MDKEQKIRKNSRSSLEAKRPDLVKYFDSDQNGFTPSMVSGASKEVMWWKREFGHSLSRSVGVMPFR
jgi:hypothetical protein